MSRDPSEVPFYFKMFTELCAKSGSIAMIIFRNIANKLLELLTQGADYFLITDSGALLLRCLQMRLFSGLGRSYIERSYRAFIFSLGRGFWSCVASCFQLFYVKDQCRMIYRILSWYVHLFCFSTNLLVLAFYHECRSLIGYATHYLFCDKKCAG